MGAYSHPTPKRMAETPVRLRARIVAENRAKAKANGFVLPKRPMFNPMNFGRMILQVLKTDGISPKEFSYLMEMPYGSIYKILAGTTTTNADYYLRIRYWLQWRQDVVANAKRRAEALAAAPAAENK